MRKLRGGVIAGRLALAVVPGSAQAGELRAGVGKTAEAPSGGTGAVHLLYPKPVKDRDITSRPPAPGGGVVRVRVGSRVLRVAQRHGSVFRLPAPAGAPVSLVAARDRHHNYVGAP